MAITAIGVYAMFTIPWDWMEILLIIGKIIVTIVIFAVVMAALFAVVYVVFEYIIPYFSKKDSDHKPAPKIKKAWTWPAWLTIKCEFCAIMWKCLKDWHNKVCTPFTVGDKADEI
jgi:heme/copper-type cytochrome/quinol oxidase subunit 2